MPVKSWGACNIVWLALGVVLVCVGCWRKQNSRFEEQWNCLRAGMTEKQVRALLGSPTGVVNDKADMTLFYGAPLGSESMKKKLILDHYVVCLTNGVVEFWTKGYR